MASHTLQRKKRPSKQAGVSKTDSPDHLLSTLRAESLVTNGVVDRRGVVSELSEALEECESLRQQLAAQRHQLDAATARADRLEDDLIQFASATSHDVSAPLRAISGFSELLHQEHGDQLNDNAKRYLNRISGGVKRMKTLLDSVSEYAHASTVELQSNQVDLNDIFDRVLDDLHDKIQKSNAIVVREQLPVIVADQRQMTNLMRHLIDNSICFAGENQPEVIVSAERNADQWLIKIKDNGRGIGTEQVKSAFKMFRRFDYENCAEGGTGAGLTICKQIAKRHNSEISIHSKLGFGTTVKFSVNTDVATLA